MSDPQRKWLFWLLLLVFGGGGAAAAILLPTWVAPWTVSSEEWGPPAIAMDTFRSTSIADPRDLLAFPAPDPVEDRGVPASAVYRNVEVLGDLDAAQFDRLMQAITLWVAPEAGCGKCHVGSEAEGFDYADPSPAAYAVSRQMLRMVRRTNAEFPEHVMPQGVTCFTCHRGEAVPPATWVKAAEQPPPEERWFQKPPPWIRTAQTIREFFPREAFELFILEDNRAAGVQARAWETGAMESDIKGMPLFTKAENVYLFMMQMSDALGVNCVYCHNSRVIYDWSQSTPARVTAWHAIRNTQAINHDFIEPLKDVLPPERLGPAGDPMKANCRSCHYGVRVPLGGVPMIEQFPGLVGESE